MAEKKYKVAENSSVVVQGVVLKSGEVIPAGAVNETALKQLVAAKLIVEDKDAKSADDGGKNSGGKSGAGKSKTDGAGTGEDKGGEAGTGENAVQTGEQGGAKA